MVFYETMQERVASILAELDVRAELALEVRCDMRPGRCAFWRAACENAAHASNLTLALSLLLNFKFRPCRAAFKFHHRGRRRLNSVAMRVRYPKLSVAVQNVVKFYFGHEELSKSRF